MTMRVQCACAACAVCGRQCTKDLLRSSCTTLVKRLLDSQTSSVSQLFRSTPNQLRSVPYHARVLYQYGQVRQTVNNITDYETDGSDSRPAYFIDVHLFVQIEFYAARRKDLIRFTGFQPEEITFHKVLLDCMYANARAAGRLRDAPRNLCCGRAAARGYQ
jgi:hypothetical protein